VAFVCQESVTIMLDEWIRNRVKIYTQMLVYVYQEHFMCVGQKLWGNFDSIFHPT
jgi:hypothetical protein